MKINNIKYKAYPTKKNPSVINPYRTADLYLSAFLRAKGTILQETVKKSGKVFFIFKDDGSIQDLINQYFNDSSVGVLSYKAALRDLRSIIFDYQNSFLAKEKRDG